MCVVTGHFQSQNIECECGQYMMVVHTCTICPPFIVESKTKEYYFMRHSIYTERKKKNTSYSAENCAVYAGRNKRSVCES